MNEMARIVADSYNHNTYNITRCDNIPQQVRMFIESGFERMVSNSLEDVGDNHIPKILELGCGCGVPYTKMLSTFGKVLGCDISSNQITCAKLNVPNALFVQKDIMDLRLRHKYDMITMFNSFFNISMSDKPKLLGRMYYWLKSYGVVIITTYGDKSEIKYNEDFYGAPMMWHHISVHEFEKLARWAGFSVVSHECTDDSIGSQGMHLWTLEKI